MEQKQSIEERTLGILRLEASSWMTFKELAERVGRKQGDGFLGALSRLVRNRKVLRETVKSRRYYRATRQPGPLKPYLCGSGHKIALFRNSEGEQISVFIEEGRFRAQLAVDGEYGSKEFPEGEREQAIEFAIKMAQQFGLPMGDEFPATTPEELERLKNPQTRQEWFEALGLGMAAPGEVIIRTMHILDSNEVLIKELGEGWEEITPCSVPEGMEIKAFATLLGAHLFPGSLPKPEDSDSWQPFLQQPVPPGH